MPPGQTIPTNLSWTVAKSILSSQDMERLACAFLHATDPVNFNAAKAGQEFGNVKAESFKRSIWVITKKIKEAAEGEGGGGGGFSAGASGHADGSPARAKAGRKRKAAGGAKDGGRPSGKKGKGTKRSWEEVESEDDEEDGVVVKREKGGSGFPGEESDDELLMI